MALTLYRRGEFYWVRGTANGRALRHTLDTRNKEVAAKRAAALELGIESGLRPLTLGAARERFLALYAGGSRHNFAGLFRRLVGALGERRFLHDVGAADLEAYLAARAIGPNTMRREIEHLRRLFAWAADHEHAAKSPAQKLRLPAAVPAETQPFSREELERLERAIDRLAEFPELADRLPGAQARLRAQLAVLVHTGIRGSDLVQLRPEHVAAGCLMLRTQKTRAQVRIPLSEPARRALAAVEPTPAGYYFWTGAGRWQTARANLRRTFARLGARAGVPNCHPHRCRDTFSVNLLLAGADIRIVSKLLGHASIRTTEKHYAPWVQGFQDQAARAIAAAYNAPSARRSPVQNRYSPTKRA